MAAAIKSDVMRAQDNLFPLVRHNVDLKQLL